MNFLESITTGRKTIMNTGVFYLFDNENECEFTINDVESSVKIRLIFQNLNDGGQRIERKIVDKVLELHCINFDPVGTGLKDAPNIGTVVVTDKDSNKKVYKVYFTFWANKLGKDKNWRIEYTFYIEGE